MLKKLFSILLLMSLVAPQQAAGQSGLEFFSGEPAERRTGRNVRNCLFSFGQFLLVGAGLDTIPSHVQLKWPPFLRDIFLLPAQYADVMNIERQANRARTSVMGAALRCDMNRLQSYVNAYYKLEAELYYVRYFVDAGGGWFSWALPGGAPRILRVTTFEGQRAKFVEDMIANFAQIRTMDSDQARLTFSAYFNEFEEKYRERARTYAGLDDVWSELKNKLDELVETFRTFGNLGNEFKELGKETAALATEVGTSVAGRVTTFFKSPAKSIGEGILEIHNRFQVCPLSDNSECKPGYKALADTVSGILGVGSSVRNFSERRSFEDLSVAIMQQEQTKTDDMARAEMLTRYEVLYGQVNGNGVLYVIDKMDELVNILSNPSIAGLNRVSQCAEMIRKRECQ